MGMCVGEYVYVQEHSCLWRPEYVIRSLELELQAGVFLEPNLGPLKEQYTILTTAKLSLQTL